jgi:competence protein ComEC
MRVILTANLSPPQGPVEPGGFDFSRAAWFEGLGATGFARGDVVRLHAVEAPELALFLDSIRMSVAVWVTSRMSGEAGAFAAAVSVGDRSALPQDAVQALRDSGLAHLLAISGLHMAMVGGLVFGLVRIALVLVPGIGVRFDAKRWAALAALLAATGYLVLSGASVSTVRAYVIALVAFTAILLGRSAVTMRALALAATLILLTTPEALFNVGFQMSFAAALALVAVYEVARDRSWFTRAGQKVGAVKRAARACGIFAVATAMTSLVAGLATAPFAGAAFNRAAFYGLPANLLGTPVMGLVVAPSLVASAITQLLGLGAPGLPLAGWGIDWILAVARTAAEAPGAVRLVPAPPSAALWFIVVGGLWLCLWRRRLRLLGIVALIAGLSVWASASRPQLLVAQGGAAVGVLSPEGRAILATQKGAFAGEVWLRRDADHADFGAARAREGFSTTGAWRRATFGTGGVVYVHLGPRAPASHEIARKCKSSTVIVIPRAEIAPEARQATSCVLLDRAALSGGVAFAIDANAKGLSIRSTRPRAWLGAQ